MKNKLSFLFWVDQNGGKKTLDTQGNPLRYCFEKNGYCNKQGEPVEPQEKTLKPVYAKTRINARAVQISTGVYVLPEQWNFQAKNVKGHSRKADAANVQLEEVRKKIHADFQALCNRLPYFTAEEFKAYYQQEQHEEKTVSLQDCIHVLLNEENLSPNTIKNRRTTCSTLKRYLSTLNIYPDSPAMLLNRKDLYLQFSKFCTQKSYTAYTVNEYSSVLQRIVGIAAKLVEDFSDRTGEPLRRKVTHLQKWYSAAQQQAIMNLSDFSHFNEYIVVKTHQLQMMLGLSFIDMRSLRWEHVQKQINGKEYIFIKRQKTKVLSVIPFTPEAKALALSLGPHMQRVRGREKNYQDYIVPIPAISVCTLHFKAISKKLGFKLHSHKARYTFGLNMLNIHGYSIAAVSRMMGHKTISTTENIYVSVLPQRVIEETERIHAEDMQSGTEGIRQQVNV